MKTAPITLLLIIALIGCGAPGLTGSYDSEIRHTGAVNQERVEQLQSEPAQGLILNGDGTFSTTRGSQTIWKGRWKVESDKLLLRAAEVNGVAVGTQLQSDVTFLIQKDGSIIDSRTSGDGYERVYRRK